MLFRDRQEAGVTLGKKLEYYFYNTDTVVLGLPRGGIPVAFEVAKAIFCPMDVLLIRKLGAPLNNELAIGAVANDGTRVLNHELISALNISEDELERITERERKTLKERSQIYESYRQPLEVKGANVILVDDGIATGSSIQVAVRHLRYHDPAKIIVAAPVSSLEAVEQLKKIVDEVVCCATPEPFYSVGSWYKEFNQVDDNGVCNLLDRGLNFRPPPPHLPNSSAGMRF